MLKLLLSVLRPEGFASRSDTDNEKKCGIVAGYEIRHRWMSLFHILLFYLLYIWAACFVLDVLFWLGAWG